MPYLRVLLDEVCMRSNFVASNVWQKRYSRENREAIGDVHEYIIVFAKDPEIFKQTRNRVPLDEKSQKIYKNPYNDPRGRWRGIPMTAQKDSSPIKCTRFRPPEMPSTIRRRAVAGAQLKTNSKSSLCRGVSTLGRATTLGRTSFAI